MDSSTGNPGRTTMVRFLGQMAACLFIFQFLSHCSFADTLDVKREQAMQAYFAAEYDKSLALFRELADAGDAESQYYLGLIYLTEDWPGKNTDLGIGYLKSAADQSNTDAMWKLGDLYDNGTEIPAAPLVAEDWYRQARQSEKMKSGIRFMGNRQGKLDFADTSDVVAHLKQKATGGDVEAQYKLAKVYDDGKIIQRDPELAFYWYEKAAKNGHAYSMFMTGYLLCRGIGVEVDPGKSDIWLKNSGRNVRCQNN